MKFRTLPIHNSVYAALIFAAVFGQQLNTRAQTLTWQTHFEGSGRINASLIDPFSADPSQPGLFYGGSAFENDGCPVKLIDPSAAAAGCSDLDSGAAIHLGVDSVSGRLYSVGSSAGIWRVRASADGGSTWQLEDTYALNGQGSQASGCASDNLGNFFVSGWAKDAAGDNHWIVRKRDAGGVWSTVRDWSEKRRNLQAVKVRAVNGYLFVVGSVGNADKWAVQRLNLSNGTWETPYVWAPKGKRAGAVAITSLGSDIYVLGWAGGPSLEAAEQCVLQRSSDNGNAPWQTVATFADSIQINRPRDLAFDASGNLYIIGESTFANTAGSYIPRWIVRFHSAQYPIANNWESLLPLGNNENLSYAKSVSADAYGNVFISGDVQLAPNFNMRHVIVQKWTVIP